MSVKTPVISVDTGILLEAGTNEFEVLIFQTGGERYGVNVAKVREVLPLTEIVEIPDAHPAIEGVMRIRHWVVPVVNLAKFLSLRQDTTPQPNDRLLLLEFNGEMLGFRVNMVERIFRISWRETMPLPAAMGNNAPVVSILKIQEKLIPMLDFEAIGAKVGNKQAEHVVLKQKNLKRDIRQLPLVVADDSAMIRCKIRDTLAEAGFQNVQEFTDGDAAWNYLSELVAAAAGDTVAIKDQVAGIISDVEMPRMDGLSLTRKIRETTVLKEVPVILFSSIVSQDNANKGKQVGATAQVAKPQYQTLVDKLAELLAIE
jgi:two-component system, chemotaxis family, chemotaxis protein CheV